ncbi:MAG: 2-oxoglutarate oxidoreductase subunit KorB [Candidatus Marinimicrobia bacterium]|nr:2-oxoglutarate oxidoreductase subunit KorB [Candidatus Neomarinimicrobiota bacterium]
MTETNVADKPKTQFKVKDYKSDTKPIWCPGCGDFGVLASLYQALAKLNLPSHEVAIISGIGCSSRLPGYVATYGFNAVHGRILPIATGVKMASPEITVIGTGGDGDGFSIGMGHVPHAARRNVDMTYIVMDNEIYGLTKGQLSPTAHVGDVTKTSAYGSIERPVEPVDLMINVGASFVARANAGDPKQMADLIVQAIQHKGFAFIDALSPCRTFRGIEQKKFINANTFKVEDHDHDPSDKRKALDIADSQEGISTGLLYVEERPPYDELYKDLRDRATQKPVPEIQDILQRYIP